MLFYCFPDKYLSVLLKMVTWKVSITSRYYFYWERCEVTWCTVHNILQSQPLDSLFPCRVMDVVSPQACLAILFLFFAIAENYLFYS